MVSVRTAVAVDGVEGQTGHWQEALLHIPPIVAFMLGVALAQMLAQPHGP